MLKVGITGGIGTGKSEVCRMLEELGAKVLYADNISKNLLDTEPTIKARVKKVFGEDIYGHDNLLDRKKLAKLIFFDLTLKEKIENIVHPKVVDFVLKVFDKYEKSEKQKVVFLEAALIYEAEVDKILDYVIVIDAPEDICIQRVVKRDMSNSDAVISRIKSQMEPEKKVKMADFVIKNYGDINKLETNVKFLYKLLNQIADKK